MAADWMMLLEDAGSRHHLPASGAWLPVILPVVFLMPVALLVEKVCRLQWAIHLVLSVRCLGRRRQADLVVCRWLLALLSELCCAVPIAESDH